MEKIWVHRSIEEFRDEHPDGSELGLMEGGLIAGLIVLGGKINDIVEWINKQELVDSGGKITEEGWKALTRIVKEREHEQARGEHDPK